MLLVERVQGLFAESAALKTRSAEVLAEPLARAARLMTDTLLEGNKIMACGNGGSAADAQHFAGEMLNRFEFERPGLPALALGVDPPDPMLMRRSPRDPSFRLLSVDRLRFLGIRGALIGAAVLIVGATSWYGWGSTWTETRSLMFTALVFAHVVYAFAARLPARSRPKPSLMVAVALAIVLQVVVTTWPPAFPLFDTTSLDAAGWLAVSLAGVVPAGVMAVAATRRMPGRDPAGR